MRTEEQAHAIIIHVLITKPEDGEETDPLSHPKDSATKVLSLTSREAETHM